MVSGHTIHLGFRKPTVYYSALQVKNVFINNFHLKDHTGLRYAQTSDIQYMQDNWTGLVNSQLLHNTFSIRV